MKLGTNIKHHYMMSREQESLLQLHFLWNYDPLKILVWKPFPINNSETLGDIFTKLCTIIKHYQMMCTDQVP